MTILNNTIDENGELLDEEYEFYTINGEIWEKNFNWEAYSLTVHFWILSPNTWPQVFGQYADYVQSHGEDTGFHFNAEVTLEDFDLII